MIQNYLRLAALAIVATLFAFPSTGFSCSMTSNPEVTIALGDPAPHTISEDEILEGTPTCTGFIVSVFNTNGSMRLNPVVDCNDIGDRLLVKVTSDAGNSVWSYVTIVDNLKPVVTATNITVTCVDDIVALGNAAISASDNCTTTGDLEFRITSTPSSIDCANGIAQTFIRSIFVIDESGNRSATVPQTITVERVDIADVDFPANITYFTSDTTICPAAFGTPEVELPTVNGNSISSICKLLTTVEDEPLSSCGSSRKILRNYRVLDCCTNEIRTSFQVITIMDDQAPQILTGVGQALQDTINAVNIQGNQNCTGTVFFQSIAAQDLCGSNPLTYRILTPFGMLNSNGGLLNASFPLDGTSFNAIYEVSDACGNVARDTVVVLRNDNQAPVAICDEITTVSLATAATTIPAINFDDGSYDNCFIDSFTVRRMGDISWDEFVTFTCDDVGDTVLVEFRVTDFDGNFNICMVSVIVEDKSPASVNPLPTLTFSCIRNPVDTFFSGVPTVNEVCIGGYQLDTIINDDSMLQCRTGVQKRKFIFTNAAGEMIMTTQMINYVDSGSFIIPTSLPDTTIDCSVDPLAMPTVQFSTDCDVFAVNTSAATTRIIDCRSTEFNVVYNFMPLCGNGPGFTLTRKITSIDTDGPVFDQSPGELDATFACTLPAVRPLPTATDNCNGAIVTLVDSTTVSTGAPGCPDIRTTYTYTTEDLCGNVNPVPYIQVISLRDTIAPTFGSISDFTLACKVAIRDTFPAYTAVANGVTDNCMQMVNVQIQSSIYDTADVCIGSILRTYLATDLCGNTSTGTQTISYDQTNQGLLLNTLDPVTGLQCYDDVVNSPNPSLQALGGSACGSGLIITGTTTDPNPMVCPATILRTYTVEDNCGNMGMITQSFSYNDDIAPVVLGVVDLNFQCQSDVPHSNLTMGALSISENCSVDTLVASDFISGLISDCSGTIVRTYTAVDDCGNTGTAEQTITWNGVGTLTLTAPTPITNVFNCYQDILDTPQITDPTAFGTGFCGTPLQIDSVNHSNDPGCSGQVLRGYFLQDGCGNRDSVFQIFMLNDTIAPVFTTINDIMVVCAADVPDPASTVVNVMASDNCIGRTATVQFFSDNIISSGMCSGSLVRTYFATDGCGNVSTATQTISYDQTGQTLSFDPISPVNNLECYNEVVNAPNPTISLAGGNLCGGNLMITNVAVQNPPGTCPATVLKTFTVADDCGNSGMVTQSFTYNDITDPVISGVNDIMVQCQSDVPTNSSTLSAITATDNCSIDTIIVSNVANPLNTACAGSIIRSYTATDDCGNTAVADQSISWNGVGALSLTTPAPNATVFTCYQDILDAPQITDPTAFGTGFCGTTLQIDSVNHSTDPGCTGQVLRGYFLQDGCGNRGSVFQIFMLNDTIAPVFTTINDIMVVCAADVPDPTSTVVDVMASDNCFGRTATVQFFSDNIISSGICSGSLVRTYLATDGCGNVSTATQTISYDQTGQTLSFDPISPVNNLECYDEVVSAPNPTISLAGGNLCGGNLMITNVDVQNPPGTCPATVLKTFTVADDCGNSGMVTQSFTYNDITNPVISGVEDIMVQCQSDVPAESSTLSVITATDNCSIDTIIVSNVVNPLNTACAGSIIRSYTATDDCGNTSVADQSISWNGVGALSLTTPAPNATVFTCYQDILDAPQITDPTAFGTGFCGTPLQIDRVNHSNDPGCSGQVLRGYFLQDGCGNRGSVFQIFMLNDTTGPTFSGVMDTMIQCASDLPTEQLASASISAFDNCTMTNVSFTVSTVADSGNNTCSGFFTRTYTAVDVCGNAAEATQIISYGSGAQSLGLSDLPNFTDSLECYQDVLNVPEITDPTSFGNGVCGTALMFFAPTAHTDLNSISPCLDSVFRFYFLEDGCGNRDTVNQKFIIRDNDGPIFNSLGRIREFSTPLDGSSCEVRLAYRRNASDLCGNEPLILSNNAPLVRFPNTLWTLGDSLGIGQYIIDFTAEDQCGNLTSVTDTVIVSDPLAPNIDCNPVVFEMEPDGTVSTTIQDVIDSLNIFDLCSPLTIDFTNPPQLDFNCQDVGMPSVFTVVATDTFGNVTTCATQIGVDDLPNIDCKTLSYSVTDATAVVLNEADLIAALNIRNNCPSDIGLTITFDTTFPLIFECPIVGNPVDFPFSVEVIDDLGREVNCDFIIQIRHTCSSPPADPFALAGRVDAPLYGGAMNGTVVDLVYSGGSVQTISDADGYYSFTNVPPGAISLSAKLPMHPADRVTTYDMLRIGQHILGTKELESPLLILAADVNQSGSVSAFDLTAIRRVILGQDHAFAGVFEATTFGAYHPFSDQNAPWVDASDWGTSFPYVSTDMMSQDISLVKLGDINPTDFLRPRSASELELEDAYVAAGETVEILVRNDYQTVVAGLQLAIKADGTLAIDRADSNIEVFSNEINGATRISMIQEMLQGEPIMTWTFTPNTSGLLSELIQISTDIPNESYAAEDLQPAQLALNWQSTLSEGSVAEINAFPNPFDDHLSISAHLTETGKHELQVSDMSGRSFAERRIDVTQDSWHNLRIDATNWSPGVYILSIEGPTGRLTQRVVLQR